MSYEGQDPEIDEVERKEIGEILGEDDRTPFQNEAPGSFDVVDVSERAHFIVPAILFCMTLLTTLLAGAYQEGGDPWRHPIDLRMGIPFSFSLMSILFIHEMGHYLTSRHYGVKTTLPYFIPGPWPPFGLIGTFGAFIKMRSPILRKNALMDIGAAGPIAGFVVSIVAVGVGLHSSKIVQVEEGNALFSLGDPLIFSFLASLMGKVPPPGYDVALNSVAFAGWIGFFVTSLNLLPIGQLDGGHIAYAMLGGKQRFLSIGMVAALVVLGAIGWPGWYVWAALTAVLGVRHPPIRDEGIPLDRRHRLIGVVSLVLFILTFMPVPFKMG